MADVIIRGITYSGIATLSIPADGGGTETFMQPSGAISITDNGVVDVTDYASAVVNVSGGGGGPTASDAILLVTVPAGSVVTATKGNDTLVPTLWVSAADSTLEKALFVIESSLFDSNPWTVTATQGANTASDTVLITTNNEYEVELSFAESIYYQGDEVVSITGGWALAARSGYNGTLTKNASDMVFGTSYVSGSHFAYGFLRANNQISLADYNTVRIKVTAFSNSNPAQTPCYILARTNDNADFGPAGSPTTGVSAYSEIGGVGTFDLDVSALTGSYYVGVGCGHGNSNSAVSVTISEISLV